MTARQADHTSPRWLQILISVLMISSLLAGCTLPWQKTAEHDIDPDEDSEMLQIPTRTQQPRKDLPPALVEVDPLPESVIALQQPITLYFNQPMDTASVEAAVHFEPRINGRFSWDDDQVLTFTPDQALAAGSRLHLAINTSAQAANRVNLQEAIELDFQVADSLKVIQTVPDDGTLDVDPESTVFVVFNQPVVPLGAELDVYPVLSFSPEVTGEGKWLNTSTYVFTPDLSMDGGTRYTIQLNSSLSAASGSGLADDQKGLFEFTTTRPSILSILPPEDEHLSLDGPIEVRFNIRMDADSVEEHFSLVRSTGTAVPGSFVWDENGKIFTFTPDRLLARNTRYNLHLAAGAQSLGGLPTEEAIETTRTTYPAFSVDTLFAPQLETYYGQYGQYQLRFTTPIDRETYQNRISITPDVSLQSTFLTDGDRTLFLSGFFQAETSFTLTVESDLADIWGTALGENLTYSFSSPPAEPTLSVASDVGAHNLVFVPASSSELVMQATNINTLTMELAPITVNDLMTLLHPENYDYRQLFLPDDIEVTTRPLSLTRNVNEIIRLPLTYGGRPLTPGIYYLRVFSPDLDDRWGWNERKLYVIVSENNLVMKMAPDQALVWATRLAAQSALNNAPVTIYNTEGERITSGRTDARGLFIAEFERFDDPFTSFYAIVGEPGQQDFAFTISSWGQGYALYEAGILLDTLPALNDAYLYTDRPVYRPGDTVHFRAAVFSRENGLPVLMEHRGVQVNVYGDPGLAGIPAKLYSEVHTLSQYGTIAGSVDLPQQASPGMYRIELIAKDQPIRDLYFDVAAYRKPEIEVNVEFLPSIALAGQDLTGEVQAGYYFGMPADDLALSWALFMEQTEFKLPGYQVGPSGTAWLMPQVIGFPSLGKLVASGEGRTDPQGHIHLAFTPEDLVLDESHVGSLMRYHLEATIVDQTGFMVSYRDTVLLHPESYYIGVQPETFFGRVDNPFDFSILTVDWEQQAVGDVALEAVFETIQWTLEETLNPERPYRYVPETERVASASPVTDHEGQARLSFMPTNPGTYQLTLTSGNAVTQVVVWVSGAGSAVWPLQTHNQVTLTPDASGYQLGQVAQVFLPNPFSGTAKALVTLERGQVMDTQVVDIEGAGHMLSIPITSELIPNVYLSVVLLGRDDARRPGFRQGILNLPVEPIGQTLNVDLDLDPAKTEPGETVSMKLTVTDHQGRPVQGEFSIAVIDKALLALVDPISPPVLEALYGDRPLSVQTSISLMTYAALLAIPGMDIGLGGGSDRMESPAVREDFPDTAFWRADVITAADGTALLEIPMPDTLTTWVVDVRGLTEDYQVGQAEAEILTHKQLMIRPVTPRFLVDGDRVELAAIVHNDTQGSLDVRVSLQGTGIRFMDDLSREQIVSIPARGRERVDWWVEIESVDLVNLVFAAESDRWSDASAPIWGDLQVLRYHMPTTFSTSGQLSEEGQRLELVSLPMSADPHAGDLSIELTPSLTAALVDGLHALERVPYQNTVSIISRLLANLHVYLTLRKLEIESPQLAENLSDLVNEGVHQLLDSQNYDGGWSWWGVSTMYRSSSSDPFITAYVLLGLEQAADAGMEVGEHFITRAKNYLSDHLVQPDNIESAWMLDRLAFQVYVLREGDLVQEETLDGLFTRRTELSPWAVGLLALTLREQDLNSIRVNTLLSNLEGSAIRSATGVHWQAGQTGWHLPGSLNFNTAVAVFALARLDPASISLSQAVRYLMTHRGTAGLWSSTFDSAWGLMAITEALQGTGDYQSDFDYRAYLNHSLFAEGDPAGPTSTASVKEGTSLKVLHPDAPNTLLIERSAGAGTLYYRADLQTYHPAGEASAINRGISLERAYYLAGEGCPAVEGCISVNAITLDPEDPSQIITVALTVVIANDMVNFMLEDTIPAGTEILNRQLLTSPTLSEESVEVYDVRKPFKHGWRWWHFSQPQIYDTHVLWTADYLPAGTYILTYELLPFQRGIFQVLPAHAWQFFYPEVHGTSSGDIFTIE